MSLIISKEYAAEISACSKIEVATPAVTRLHLDTVSADDYTAQMAREDAISCGAADNGIASAAYGKLEVSVDGPERKYYTLRTYSRFGGVVKMGSLGLNLRDAMANLIERQSLKGFVVVVIEDSTRDLRNRCIGFGEYADRTIIDMMSSDNEAERKRIASYSKAATLRDGKPCLFWAGGIMKNDIAKSIPMWLYETLVAVKAEQDELSRAYKAEQLERKAGTSFHVGEIDQRIKSDSLTCTEIITYVDPKCIYTNGETHSYKARFTNKDGQIIEAYASRNQYAVGESFDCAMTVKAHFATKEGDRITRVNRITKK